MKRADSNKKVGAKARSKKVDNARERLIEVGRAAFFKNGSKGISVRQVAQKANVNLGSFVYHFKTKEVFIEEVIYSYYDEFLEILNQSYRVKADEDQGQTVRQLLESMGRISTEHAALLSRFILDIINGEKIVIQALVKNPPKHIPFVVDLIRQWQRQGAVRNDVDPSLVFFMLVSSIAFPQAIFSHLASSVRNPKAKELATKVLDDKFLKARIDFALKGLKP
jgi:AcrR family transcriptional regulator